MKSSAAQQRSAMPYVLILGFLFGSTLLASRFSVGQFAAPTYVSLRLIIASLAFGLVFLFSAARSIPTDRTLWRRSIFLGAFGTAVPMMCLVGSLNYQSAGVTGLLLTTAPAFTIVFAHFLLPDEPLSGRKVIGVVLALGGAGLLIVSGENGLPGAGRANPLGYILALSGIIINSLMTIYARKYMRHMNTFDVTAVRMLAAAAVAFPASLLLAGFDLSGVERSGWMALFYAALVGTFSGMLLAFWVTRHYGATAVSMTAYIIPIVAAVGGVLFLDETFTTVMLVGMALIIVGVTIINRKRPPPVEIPEV